MKVKELIEKLKQMPQDLEVLTSGYEDGYENILKPVVMDLVRTSNAPYFQGEFQEAENNEQTTFKAVVIKRNRRDDD